MLKKIVIVIGVLGALAAAEGLNRFGGLVSAFGGGDAPIYMGMLIISVISAGVLLMSIFNKSNSIVKWLTFVLLLGSTGLMMAAPAFPVNVQIVVGLIAAAFACLFISKSEN
jgi:hypothetical protein